MVFHIHMRSGYGSLTDHNNILQSMKVIFRKILKMKDPLITILCNMIRPHGYEIMPFFVLD